MSSFAIRATGLGKQYEIGAAQERYQTLRDSIVKGVQRPFQSAWHLATGKSDPARQQIWALRDVSFEAKPGEVIGFIGRNGAGKSTLLKVLSRITAPTVGRAEIYGRIGSLLEVGTGFHPELTGRENIYLSGAILGMRKAAIEDKFDRIVEFSEVGEFVDTPVKHYSSGMYLRMAFAVAAHLDPEILLVDEVLAVGDAAFQKKCLSKMVEVARQGQTVLFVSHNLDAVLTLCTRCIVMANGRAVFDGRPPEAVTEYHRLLNPNEKALDESVLYAEAAEEPVDRTVPRVTKIEMLRPDGSPMATISTWDDSVMRLHYWSPSRMTDASFILDIRDYKEQRLIVLDSGVKVPLEAGHGFVDCRIPKLPLPSGEYFLTIGISNPFVDWLWRKFSVGALRVYGKDVYGIGRPPAYSRMAIVADCEWRPGAAVGDGSQRTSEALVL